MDSPITYSKEDILNLDTENAKLKVVIKKRLYGVLGLSSILMCLASAIVIQSATPNLGETVAFSPDGQVSIIKPNLNELLPAQHVFNFATDTVVELNTYLFRDYQNHLRNISDRFSYEGWDAFLTSFSESGTFERISDEYINLVSVPATDNRPNAGRTIIDGKVTWFVRVKILSREENLSGEDQHSSTSYLVRLVEVERSISPYGLQISDIGLLQ